MLPISGKKKFNQAKSPSTSELSKVKLSSRGVRRSASKPAEDCCETDYAGIAFADAYAIRGSGSSDGRWPHRRITVSDRGVQTRDRNTTVEGTAVCAESRLSELPSSRVDQLSNWASTLSPRTPLTGQRFHVLQGNDRRMHRT